VLVVHLFRYPCFLARAGHVLARFVFPDEYVYLFSLKKPPDITLANSFASATPNPTHDQIPIRPFHHWKDPIWTELILSFDQILFNVTDAYPNGWLFFPNIFC
jgi:hypothetical protein